MHSNLLKMRLIWQVQEIMNSTVPKGQRRTDQPASSTAPWSYNGKDAAGEFALGYTTLPRVRL